MLETDIIISSIISSQHFLLNMLEIDKGYKKQRREILSNLCHKCITIKASVEEKTVLCINQTLKNFAK